MKLIPFSQIRQKLQPGVPLPWNVRNEAGELLLAKGRVIAGAEMLAGLMARGAFADADEIAQQNAEDDAAMTANLTSSWSALEARLGGILRSPAEKQFLQRVRETLVHIAAATHNKPDEVIYLVLRHDYQHLSNYGIAHALHAAALCGLLARRLGWANQKSTSLMGAALTMNISILELQGRLASRGQRPTDSERQQIAEHPATSGKILRLSGLRDEDWLQTVEQHHEIAGGKGYPLKLDTPTEMSQLLRFVDVFTAKHSPRAGRTPMPAQQAARELFTQGNGNPLASLLIKELGIYPPGCYVKLANGEIAIVTRVGATAKTPFVAVLVNRQGEPLLSPVHRDTSEPGLGILETVPDSAVRVNFALNTIYEIAGGTP